MKRTMLMLFCCVTACALCLVALPKTARAAVDNTMDFSINGLVNWHNGSYIDYSSQDDQDAGWTWKHSTKTLTLSGLRFETENQVAVRLPAGATLHLAPGTVNALTANPPRGSSTNVDSAGVVCMGALTITGSGTLTVTAGTRQTNGKASYGVYANGSVTLNGGTLVAKGNLSEAGASYGVAPAAVTVNGGKLVAQGYTMALQSALSFDPATVVARGSRDYEGTNLADYDFSANPPQRYVATFAPVAPSGANVPKTGDSTPLALLCGLALLSGAGLAIPMTIRRRKRAR